MSILGSISVFSVVTVFLFELFQNKVLKKFNIVLTKGATQVLTWIFAFIIVYITGLMGFGTFTGVTLIYTVLIGLLTGLSANGIWTFPPIQTLLGKQ